MAFRLVLVTEEVETARIFKEAVARVGVDAITIESAELAARRIREEKFDGIFIDPTVPNLSRQGFTRLIRNSKFNSQAPIVLLRSYPREGTVTGKASDGVSVMVRPSSAADLMPFLKELKRKLVAERRRYRRLPFRTNVNCLEGIRRFRATSVNVSATGMLLDVSSALERGDELEVYFSLAAEDPPFRARVRVVRIGGPNRVATAFQNLGSPERQRLRGFLDQHLPPLR